MFENRLCDLCLYNRRLMLRFLGCRLRVSEDGHVQGTLTLVSLAKFPFVRDLPIFMASIQVPPGCKLEVRMASPTG